MSWPTILVVDADVSFGRQVVEVCRQARYFAIAVQSASAAMHYLEQIRYELVLIDLSLPDVDSLELLEQVALHSPVTGTIVVAPFHSVEVSHRAGRAGACDYIVKPVSSDELAARLARALDGRDTSAGSTG
jgi:DNA-binding response OmpR family regulator